MATLAERAAMAWGKVRRFALITIFKKRAAADLARRRGACTNCGACCKILFKCPAFEETPAGGWCTIYNDRPGVCALFPINEKDLRERDVVMPERRCGYSFAPADAREPDLEQIEGPLRALKENPRRRKIVKSTLAIFLSRFRRPSESVAPDRFRI